MKNEVFLAKILGLLSVVRGYNLLLIAIAQYLVAICILSKSSVVSVLTDVNLLALVLSSTLAVAGGYIINAFYDQEKDLINTPQRVLINKLVGQNTKLTLYFLLNLMSIIVASYVSFRSVVFFSGYVFLLWFYSHKLKKIRWVGSIIQSLLSVIPLLAILLYYKHFEFLFFAHALYILLLIFAKNFIKDLLNLKGDFAGGYQTIAVVYGENFTKKVVITLLLAEFIPIYWLMHSGAIGHMTLYFYTSSLAIIVAVFLLLKKGLWLGYQLLRLIILLGVLSMILILY